MKKRVLLVALALAMFASTLAGCSSTPKSTGESTGTSKAASTDGASSTATPTGTNEVVTVWGFGEEGKILPEMKADFESKNPGIELSIQAIPWDSADEKLTAAFAGKSGPDVIQMQTYTISNYISAGALYDLTDLSAQYPSLAPENFFDAAVQTVSVDGKQYGVPWYVDASVLFYRTDILKEAGFENPPKTWDEMTEMATVLAARGEGQYGFGLAPANAVPGLTYAWQNGGDLFVDGKATTNTPEFIGAMEFYHSFFANNLTPGADTDLMQAFIDGSVPMTLQEPWVMNTLQGNAEMDGKWATAVLPKQENGLSYVGGCALVMSGFTKVPDAAATFIAYMAEPENQVKWNELSKTLPANKAAWEDEKLAGNASLDAFRDQLNEGRTAPPVGNFIPMVIELTKAMERINVGNEDVATVCDELNTKIDELLAEG